jgi:hypothetical protein
MVTAEPPEPFRRSGVNVSVEWTALGPAAAAIAAA